MTHLRQKKIAFFILGLLLICFPLSAEDFKRAFPGRAFSFPQDHYAHPEFKTEWWYYSGHLQSLEKNQGTFGYQLTFFRTGLKREGKTQRSKWSIQDLHFAHLAITDETRKNFEYRERMSRGSLGEAGASEKSFRIWIEDWSIEGKGPAIRNHVLKAGDGNFGIELVLTPAGDPVIHGQNGISQKAEGDGHASHYYSITRLKTEGRLFLKGREVSVHGVSWMDHEFGSNQLQDDQVGWDWFSIQLDQGTDLMIYQIRRRDGRIDPYSSGTIIFPDGKHQHLSSKEFRIDVLEKWRSRKSDGNYPSRWVLRMPGLGMDLTLVPTVKDQELITKESTRVTYWEGSVRIEGTCEKNPCKGMGYAELTGYAKPFSKGI